MTWTSESSRFTHHPDGGPRALVPRRGLLVEADGREVATLSDGDQFGEIALLRNIPRTASVTATEPTTLLALSRREFLAAVAGSRPSSAYANELVDRRLEELGHNE